MEDRFSTSEARGKLAEITNEVVYGGHRILLHRHGKDLAAVVSVRDLALLEAIEDRMDLEEALSALKQEGKHVSWKDLRKELEL
ncbi:MAG: type II toxin-antitoxin system Phd/YefM family antitoxin [Candidatus Binatia bacterium]